MKVMKPVSLGLMAASLGGLILGIRLLPEDWHTSLFAGSALGSLLAGACLWMHRRAVEEPMSLRERSGLHPRSWGFGMAFAGIISGYVLLIIVPPGTWPSSVESAVEELRDRLSEKERREIASLHPDELWQQHFGLNMWVRNAFGLWAGNRWLLSDCVAESGQKGMAHPDGCSGYVVERLHARLRAELPAAERDANAQLDERLARVRVREMEFENTPMKQVAGWLQAELDAQLPPSERIAIHLDPEAADVTFTRTFGGQSAAAVLGTLDFGTSLDVDRRPPDVWIGPFFRRVNAALPNGTVLAPVFSSGRGFAEPVREIIAGDAQWKSQWQRIVALTGTREPRPSADFSTQRVIVVSETGDTQPLGGDALELWVRGMHEGVLGFELLSLQYPDTCKPASAGPRQLAVFVVPAIFAAADYREMSQRRNCAETEAIAGSQ